MTHKVIGLSYLGAAVLMAFVGGYLDLGINYFFAYHSHITSIIYLPNEILYQAVMIYWVVIPVLFTALGHLLIPKAIGSKKMLSSTWTIVSFSVFTISFLLIIASIIVDKYFGFSVLVNDKYVSLSVLLPSIFDAEKFMKMDYQTIADLSSHPLANVSETSIQLIIIAVALNLVSLVMNGFHFILTCLIRRSKEIKIREWPIVVWMINLSSLYLIVFIFTLFAGIMIDHGHPLDTPSLYDPNTGFRPMLLGSFGSLWSFGFLQGYSVAHIFIALTGGILADIGLSRGRPFKWQKITTYIFVLFIGIVFLLDVLLTWNVMADTLLPIFYSQFYRPMYVFILFLTGLYIWNLIKRRISLKIEVLWAFGVLVSIAGDWIVNDPVPSRLDRPSYYGTQIVLFMDYNLIPIYIILFGGFAAIYHWFPKIIGRQYSKVLAYIHFVLTLVFFYGAILLRLVPLSWGDRQFTTWGNNNYPSINSELSSYPENTIILILALMTGLALTQLIWVYNMIWSGWKGKLVDIEDVKD